MLAMKRVKKHNRLSIYMDLYVHCMMTLSHDIALCMVSLLATDKSANQPIDILILINSQTNSNCKISSKCIAIARNYPYTHMGHP